MSKYLFKIPIIEKVSANKIYAGIHWGNRKALAEKYHRAVSRAVVELPPLEHPVHLTFIFNFAKKALDCSNCFYMAKLVEDGLIRAQVLQDDNTRYVKSIKIISRKDKREQIRTLIEEAK